MKSKMIAGLMAMVVVTSIVCVGCQSMRAHGDMLRTAVERQRQMLEKYVSDKQFGKPLPKLTGAALDEFLYRDYTTAQKDQIRQAVEAELAKGYKDLVIPKWIEYGCAVLKDETTKLVEQAKSHASAKEFDEARKLFDKAREQLWNCSVNVTLDGVLVSEVSIAVHAFALKLLTEYVNVAHWPFIERELRMIAADAALSGKPEIGIENLAEYQHIRAYTKVLDDKVKAITHELSSQGIPAPATDAIEEATHAFMSEAARLADRVDESKLDKRVLKSGGIYPDDTQFKKLLAEYQAALLKYGCTEANTKKIVEWLSGKALTLYDDLPRPPPDRFVSVMTVVRLGTTALNVRIDAVVAELTAALELDVAKIKAMLQDLKAMALKDPVAARQHVAGILSGAIMAGEAERARAQYELLTKVNPALWDKIQTEIYAKVDACVKNGKCSECIAWLQSYPRVRTYPVEIDEQYAKVREAAVNMGVSPDKASEIVEKVAAITAEAENLAHYEDEIRNGIKPGVEIATNKVAAYEKAVEKCRVVLVNNGCTLANADKIVDMIHVSFSNETVKLESEIDEPVLYLGANAINVRLAALKKKAAWALLSRYTLVRLAANDAEGARKTLRSIALTGDDDFDEEVYAIRIGALNTLVNPYMLKERKPGIESNVKKFCKAGDYRGLWDWMEKYPYVHDRCEDLLKSLDGLRKTMRSIKIGEQKTAEYVKALDERIQELLDKAKGGREPEIKEVDLNAIERSVSVFEKALTAQYYDIDAVKAVCQGVKREIAAFVARPSGEALSTWDLNVKLHEYMEAVAREEITEILRSRSKYQLLPDPTEAEKVQKALLDAAQKGLVALAAGKDKATIVSEISGGIDKSTVDWVMHLCDEINREQETLAAESVERLAFKELIDSLIARQEYLEYLAAVDCEIAYDSQIAMAGDVISRELNVAPTNASLKINALLGEYARAMRMLKRKQKLDRGLGAALLGGAICLDQPVVVNLAFDLGVSPDAVSSKDPLRRPPLLLAVQLGRSSLTHLLAQKNASVTATDVEGNTALHYAVRRGNANVVKAFFGRVDVNVKNKIGETPLFDAVRVNNGKLTEMLLATNANVKVRNQFGHSVFDVASMAGGHHTLDALAGGGAEIGVAQLVLAVKSRQLAVVQWLIERGVDVNGEGVMDASRPYPEIFDYLRSQGGIGTREEYRIPNSGTNEISTVRVNIEADSVKFNGNVVK